MVLYKDNDILSEIIELLEQICSVYLQARVALQSLE